MAEKKDTQKEETPEEKITRLEKESAEKDALIAEMAAKSKVSVEIPNIEIEGETYQILVPLFFDGKDYVKTQDLPVEILKGQIGEALIKI